METIWTTFEADKVHEVLCFNRNNSSLTCIMSYGGVLFCGNIGIHVLPGPVGEDEVLERALTVIENGHYAFKEPE